MQMDLLEKMRKYREEKEAQAIQVHWVEIHPDGDKGKGLMRDLLEETFSQQMKALMHTSKQSKQKLAMMTSVLDTHAAVAFHIVVDIQVTATVTQPNDDQEMDEHNPFKRLKIQVSLFSTPTINLYDSDLEE